MEATDLSGLFSPPMWSLVLLLGVFLGTSLLFLGFPGSSVSKEPACNAGDPGSIPGLGRSAGEGIGYPLQYSWASLMAQLVKNPPAVWETWVRSLGQKGPLEERTDNPLQYSRLENPMDRGTWWATVHRVSKVRHD